MKTKVFLIIIVTALIGAHPVQADTEWYSGHHELVDGNAYGEVRIYNDVTLDIYGGDISYVWAYDDTLTDWYDGEMYYFVTHENSTANIYGGRVLITLGADANSIVNLHSSSLIENVSLEENAVLNLYAYDVVHHATGGYWDDGWIEGKYIADDHQFSIDIIGDSYSHINIIPEPSALLLFGLSGLLLRQKK